MGVVSWKAKDVQDAWPVAWGDRALGKDRKQDDSQHAGCQDKVTRSLFQLLEILTSLLSVSCQSAWGTQAGLVTHLPCDTEVEGHLEVNSPPPLGLAALVDNNSPKENFLSKRTVWMPSHWAHALSSLWRVELIVERHGVSLRLVL